jgi:hypothetical protein
VRLRHCKEVEAILDELRDIRGDEFEVAVVDLGPGAIKLTFRGGSEFTDDGADELDQLIRSLGSLALEPAVFTGEYDGELRIVCVDPADWSDPAPGGIPILGSIR